MIHPDRISPNIGLNGMVMHKRVVEVKGLIHNNGPIEYDSVIQWACSVEKDMKTMFIESN